MSTGLVHVNEPRRAFRHVCMAAILAGIPFVSHVRRMGWDHGWRRLGHLRPARAVVTVSRACGESVARFLPKGRLDIVRNGLPVEALANRDSPSRQRVKEELGPPPASPVILVVGHLTPRKGQIFALQALERVLGVVPDAHLCPAGAEDRDPEYVAQVQAVAARPPHGGRVTVLGFRSDVDRLLKSADVFLHVALADPHPRAVVEGMAPGLSVVASGVDGVSETVAGGEPGCLVPAEDSSGAQQALSELLLDPELARPKGRSGRRRLEQRFSQTRKAQRVGEVVEEVLVGVKGIKS